jgi:predicted O-methyltransferase YrrM
MLDLSSLTRSAWRRLAKVPPLSMPMAKLKDRIETLQFRFDGSRRKKLADEYGALGTLDDYFQFSNRVFGPHQLRPEITGFLELAKRSNPRTVCEIGTANGGTTFLLGQALPTTELLIGVDLFIRRRPRLRHLARTGQQMVLLDGDSGSQTVLDRVRKEMNGRQLDVLFIDGDHSLAGVARDFHLYRPFVRAGGLIAFHDIVEDSFTRTGIRTEHWTGEVPQFWRSIKGRYKSVEFVASPDQDGLGIGVIEYDPSVAPPGPTGS